MSFRSLEHSITSIANIVSGGTIGSAQLLQLSGVGPSDLLTGMGIKQNLNLPVGHNLQDHVSVAMYWSTPPGTLTWREMYTDSIQQAAYNQWKANGTGKLTYVNNAMGCEYLAYVIRYRGIVLMIRYQLGGYYRIH